MKTRRWLGSSLLVPVLVFLSAGSALSDRDHGRRFKAGLSGSNEVPAISTLARGDFSLRLDDAATLSYKLRYSGLTPPTTLFAHIHFGQHDVNGGVSAFLCGGGTKPAPCPNPEGEVEGTITAADVVGPSGQGIAAGEFAELLKQIRRGDTYVNVHTSTFPGGEIRGQIREADRHDDDDDR
jgi:hypothetical protein